MDYLRTLVLFLAAVSMAAAQDSECTTVSSMMDLGFAIDASGSIEFAGAWDNVRSFISDIIGNFEIGPNDVRVGAVKFSATAQVEFNLDTFDSKDAVQNFILNMPILGGTTNTQAALNLLDTQIFMRANGDRRDAPNVVIVFTDGASNVLANQTVPNANILKSEGVTIIAIGVRGGSDYNATELSLIASTPELYIERADFSGLDANLLNEIATAVQTICPPPPPGTVCVKLQQLADTVFILDRSVSFNDFNLAKGFINNYVSQVSFGPNNVRIGLVAYSTSAVTVASLAQYTDANSFLNAVSALQATSPGDGTDLTAALSLVEEMFNSADNRPDVENMVFLLTDGGSTLNQGNTVNTVNIVKRLNVTFTAIGVNQNAEYNVTELSEIASVAELYFETDSYANLQPGYLNNIFETVTSLCPVVETTCKGEFDLVIVLDASGSIGGAKFSQLKTFVSDVIRNLGVNQGRVLVGLVVFSDNVGRAFDLNRYTSVDDILAAISSMAYVSGRTNIADANREIMNMFASQLGDRADKPNRVLYFTDGGATMNIEQTIPTARQLKASGIEVVVVYVGTWVNMGEINALASFNNVISFADYAALQQGGASVAAVLCNNVDHCAESPCQRGICVDRLTQFECIECGLGFGGAQCQSQCRTEADIVFVVDRSGSIGPANFQLVINFLESVVQRLAFNGQTRVGLIAYSDNAEMQFQLNSYTNRWGILSAISTIQYTGGTTNTADALRLTREQAFQSFNGDQGNVPNIAILVTDGRSNDPAATWEQARQLRQTGAYVIGVGIQNYDVREMETIVTAPMSSNLVPLASFEELSFGANIDNLVATICNNNDECAFSPCQNGAQCTDLLNDYRCGNPDCPNGWSGKDCNKAYNGFLDIAWIIDTSGSIRRDRFSLLLNFVAEVTSMMEVSQSRVRMSAISFSDDVTVNFRLNSYSLKQDVMTAIKRIQYRGLRTNIADAFISLRTDVFTSANGDRDNAPNIAILLTDGSANINAEATIPEAIAARIAGAHIMTLTIGNMINEWEIRGITSQPWGYNMMAINTISSLSGFAATLESTIGDDVNECSSNPCENGAVCASGFGTYTCLCNSPFTGYNCAQTCTAQRDIIFVVDTSSSLDSIIQASLDFVRRVLYGLDIRSDRARIGLVSFSDSSFVQFQLGQLSGQMNAVHTSIAFRYTFGPRRTNTQEAIRTMWSSMFSTTNGARTGVQKVAIVVSDGYSNINPENTIPEATNAKNNGVQIYAVGIGANINQPELDGISSDPDSTYTLVVPGAGPDSIPTAADINSRADQLIASLCN